MSFSALVNSVIIMALRGAQVLRFNRADRRKLRSPDDLPLAVGLWYVHVTIPGETYAAHQVG
jgi:hypothetical protein